MAKTSSVILGVALCKIVSKEEELPGMANILSGIFGSSSQSFVILSGHLSSDSRVPTPPLATGQSQRVYFLINSVSSLPRTNAIVVLRGLFVVLYECLAKVGQSQDVASRILVALLIDTCQLMASHQTDIEVVYHCLAAINSGLEYFSRDMKSKKMNPIPSESLRIVVGSLLPLTDAHDSSISFASQTALDGLLQLSKLQGDLDYECLSAYLIKKIENFSFNTKSKYRCITSLLSKHDDWHMVFSCCGAIRLVNETLVAISKNASISTSASGMLREIWRRLYFNRSTVGQSQAVGDLIDEETSSQILYQIAEALLGEDVELKNAVFCYALPGLASDAPLALEEALKLLLTRSDSLKMVRQSCSNYVP